jgi:hypothetical protein
MIKINKKGENENPKETKNYSLATKIDVSTIKIYLDTSIY